MYGLGFFLIRQNTELISTKKKTKEIFFLEKKRNGYQLAFIPFSFTSSFTDDDHCLLSNIQ